MRTNLTLSQYMINKEVPPSPLCTCTGNYMIDPTKTLTLRKAFVGKMKKRFRSLKELIIPESIVSGTGLLTNAYEFSTDSEKIQDFMIWLQEQEDIEIFQRELGSDNPYAFWPDLYIDSAYKRGVRRANTELQKLGRPLPSGNEVLFSLASPIHLDTVATLYTRTFTELKGITATMDQQISRTLADGLIKGLNTKQIAAMLRDRVDKVGGYRAILLARTEIIRAHHVATIKTYMAAGVEGVTVQAEWHTAEDGRVCELCKPLEGIIFTLEEILPMIPRHPQCRCVALPAKFKEN